MNDLIFITEFIGSLIIFFYVFSLVGHLLKSDDFEQRHRTYHQERIKRIDEPNKQQLLNNVTNKETNRFTGLICFVMISVNTNAQKADSTVAFPFKVTADLVSSYVWRGSLATSNPAPNFQPTLAYVKGNFEIGVWGSTDFNGTYKEIDPYVSLTSGKFKFLFTDYFWNFELANYFNYQNDETAHRFEGAIGYLGSEALPLSITWNTMFYGYDKNTDNEQAYSTYIEFGYSKGPAYYFFGFTPWAGYYNNYGITAFDPEAEKKSFSVVNVGASVSKALKITEFYSLPIKVTLAINPSATYSKNDYIHLVFGITF